MAQNGLSAHKNHLFLVEQSANAPKTVCENQLENWMGNEHPVNGLELLAVDERVESTLQMDCQKHAKSVLSSLEAFHGDSYVGIV